VTRISGDYRTPFLGRREGANGTPSAWAVVPRPWEDRDENLDVLWRRRAGTDVGAAFAQDKTLNPNQITIESKRAPLELTARQRAVIQDGLASENTEQKAPPKFEPKVGDPVPLTMTLDVMPQ
jgi:hypothetical protein